MSTLRRHAKLWAPGLFLLVLVALVLFIAIGHTLIDSCPYDRNQCIERSPVRAKDANNRVRELRLDSLPVYLVKPEVHNQILEMYRLLRFLFDRDHITYWASAGTFLGTIRHGGFIPWDDDMDVCVKFSDVKKVVALTSEIERLGFTFRVYRDNISYVKLIPTKGVPYPFVDLIFMEDVRLSDWPPKCPEPRIKPKTTDANAEANPLYLVPRSVDVKDPYYPARLYPKEIHPYDRVFPLKEYPYHRPDTFLPGPHDTTLLDEMYPGCMAEARVEESGIMQLLRNHRTRSFTNSFFSKNGSSLKKYVDRLFKHQE